MLLAVWTWVRGRLAGGATPARLRLFASATVVVAVAFALLGAYGVDRRAGAIDQAAESADQLLLAQDVEHIGLDARLAMCDFSLPMSDEERAWIDAPDVGREADWLKEDEKP